MTWLLIICGIICMSVWSFFSIRASAIPIKMSAFMLMVLAPMAIYLLTRPLDDLHEWFSRQQDIKHFEESIAKEKNIDSVITKLEKGVQQKPKDPVGWFLLGKMHYISSNYHEAVSAFEQAYQLTNDSEILHMLVQARFWRDHLTLSDQSIIWVHELLRKHPEHYGLLNMLAIDAFKLDFYDDAIALWHEIKSQPYLPTSELEAVEQGLSEASRKFKSTGMKSHAHNLQVDVTGEASGEFQSDTTVFIVVRDAYKPKAPIAIIKRCVSDLPIHISINPSHAMLKGHDIENAHRVMVQAKVSISGMATSASGDVESEIKGCVLPCELKLTLKG